MAMPSLLDSYRWSEDAIDVEHTAWRRVWPIITLHAAAVVGVFFVPLSGIDVGVAVALYMVRMFAITGFYHRYFSHKSFKTSRAMQFAFAIVGASATQRGPLWWAAHHRQHHRSADTEQDPHDSRRGFWWSHIGWFLTPGHHRTRHELVPDLAKFPELVWLDRYDLVVPLALGAGLFVLGTGLNVVVPELGTSGGQLFFWGYVVSTLVLLHATLAINSLAHRIGRRRYASGDRSRNSFLLALVTFGEGWHNNHHRFCGSARQGFRWWQLDITYMILALMRRVGLIWDLRPVPRAILEERRP